MTTVDRDPNEVQSDPNLVSLTIDGKTVEARKGELIIAAAERAGMYIPRFCYHPRMRPVGMCRMCLVEVEGPRGPALTVSCVAEVAQDMVVHTMSDTVKKAQDGVLEFLLANHPLDCPVCDKGGECPLQDQTLTFGPGETRFVEEKRHFEKPIPISDLVLLDRERCILCDRCTRFSKEVAGDPLIHFTSRGATTEVATFPDHPFASYFSGNTVQICPVGALTSTPYRFKARPWDLEQVESTCTTCSVGCRVAVQSSNNQLTRYIGLDSDPVNHGWLCDKGRFDFEAINSDDRLRAPLVRKSGELVETAWGEAFDAAARAITEAIVSNGQGSIAMIGGARLANEDQFAWAKLLKGVIGTDHVDAQLGDGLPADVLFSLPTATIDDLDTASSVVVLSGDIKDELPVLFLRLRAAAVDHHVPVIECSAVSTGVTPIATVRLAYTPGEEPALAAALVGSKDPSGEEVAGASVVDVQRARALLGANPVVIIGRTTLGVDASYVADAALRLASSGARFLIGLRRGNIVGALDAGLVPGYLPGRMPIGDAKVAERFGGFGRQLPTTRGMDTTEILRAAAAGEVSTLILLGADPIADFPDRRLSTAALGRVRRIISIDLFNNASNAYAHVILPAAAYAEREGTTTNIEGRVTLLSQKITPPGVAWSDWMIATELASKLGEDLGFSTLADIRREYRSRSAMHAHLDEAVLRDRANIDGVLTKPTQGDGPTVVGEPRVAMRDGYAVRLVTKRVLWDHGTSLANSATLSTLAPQRPQIEVHSSWLGGLGAANGGQILLRTGSGSVEVEAMPNDDLPRGIGVVYVDQPRRAEGGEFVSQPSVWDLFDLSSITSNSGWYLDVKLESVGR
jgi:NADH-quinone oxidoreductase subunit G